MSKAIVGIDIGSSLLKLAVCADGAVRRVTAEDMPDNLVKDGRVVSPEAMAEFIKKAAAKARINTRGCALILPPSQVFARTMTLPAMTREQLVINLPYEFRDFITQEKDKYFYDYAVTDKILDESGNPLEFELIAATTLKGTIRTYSDMLRRAGFKLKTAIPDEMAYINIIRRFCGAAGDGADREYCFIDLGHTATRLHIFKGVKLQATRVMELGVRMLDMAIAEKFGVDEHIARLRKQANVNDELSDEVCANIYTLISVEIMRAVNFYRFNSPDSTLSEVFLCGGGSRIEPMVKQISSQLDMPAQNIGGLLPAPDESEDALLCPAAIGAAMQ